MKRVAMLRRGILAFFVNLLDLPAACMRFFEVLDHVLHIRTVKLEHLRHDL
jgi:hypothetical protein